MNEKYQQRKLRIEDNKSRCSVLFGNI